jgi:hypothetical protein
VWLTYMLGRAIDRPQTGLIAAILTACSPIFLLQNIAPMSDVPATAFWLGAIVLALLDGRGYTFASGGAVAIALLIRPNLLPLALVVAILIALRKPTFARLALFVVPVAAVCFGIAALNRHLYGAQTVSGYGALETMFAWHWLTTNVWRYSGWLVDLHTPFVLFGIPTLPLMLYDQLRSSALLAHVRNGVVYVLFVFIVVLTLCYLFYIPFDTWPFLRFLLPGIPILLIFSCLLLVRIALHLPNRWRGAFVFALSSCLVLRFATTTRELHVFAVASSERRYVSVGRYLGTHLPADSIVITVLHSGSLRLYGGLNTVRWDLLSSDDLDTTIDTLEAHRRQVYILLEESEDAQFRTRFSGNIFGRLDWPPSFDYAGEPHVRVWRTKDRELLTSGAKPLSTVIVPKS